MTHFIRILLSIFILGSLLGAGAEPVVLTGSMVPQFLGKRIGAIRLVNAAGSVVPYQIDEVTPEGEYVCAQGASPNPHSGNGLLDKQDEIVFLWEDADSAPNRAPASIGSLPLRITVHHENTVDRYLWIVDAPSLPKSTRSYITYDPNREQVFTPYYYAQFGHDRFHFVRAGTMDFPSGKYRDLTRELHIRIVATMLWGLIPVTFTEENLFCFVKRFKAGPIRLIRRGDFHLNVGLGIKGGRAIVNQICYPQMSAVPVQIRLPMRLRTLFTNAYIEMGPVMNERFRNYRFTVPRLKLSRSFGGGEGSDDAFFDAVPDGVFFRIDDGNSGFGWLMQTTMPANLMTGSGFVFKRYHASPAAGYAGIRLAFRDMEKGTYFTTNWVTFSQNGIGALESTIDHIETPADLSVQGNERRFKNFLVGKR